MSKLQLNFLANGRLLFESEKTAVEVFTRKYASATSRQSDQEAQERMSKVRKDVHRAVSSGQTFETAFYLEVQQAKRAAAKLTKVKTTSTKKAVTINIKRKAT